MKITGIETIRLRSHIRSPLKMAYGTITGIEPVFVCIHTDTGLSGWGEANTIPFVTGETPETIFAVLDMLRRCSWRKTRFVSRASIASWTA